MLHFTAAPLSLGARRGQFIPVHPGQRYRMARRGFTVGKQLILSGIYAFIGVGSVLLAAIWGGGGASLIFGVIWLVLAVGWLLAALQMRRQQKVSRTELLHADPHDRRLGL